MSKQISIFLFLTRDKEPILLLQIITQIGQFLLSLFSIHTLLLSRLFSSRTLFCVDFFFLKEKKLLN